MISSVFADTNYWAALVSRHDQLHDRALEISKELSDDAKIFTSDMVLVELLNLFAGHGEHVRRSAAESVTNIYTDSRISVVPQTRKLFEEAHALYRNRIDKEWSLTDCASFVIMEDKC